MAVPNNTFSNTTIKRAGPDLEPFSAAPQDLKANPYSAGNGVRIVVGPPKLPVIIEISGNSGGKANSDTGADDCAIVTFAGSEEGRRWPGYIGKAGRDRKSGILVLMFPSRFDGWLDHDRSDLPLIKEPESHVAPE